LLKGFAGTSCLRGRLNCKRNGWVRICGVSKLLQLLSIDKLMKRERAKGATKSLTAFTEPDRDDVDLHRNINRPSIQAQQLAKAV